MKTVERLSFTVVVMAMMVLPGLLYAQVPGQAAIISEADCSFKISDNTVTITNYRGNAQDIQIPNTIQNKPVVSIGEMAFYNRKLTNIVIPDTVVSIGNYAFANNQLTNVTIPNSVTEINAGAFAENKLTQVTIPNNVTTIERHSFAYNQPTTVRIPNTVSEIKSGAFTGNQITSIVIGNNINIDSDSFDNDFISYYYSNGRKAGTYVYERMNWSRK
ncbi:hypothetical protein PilKf_01432 [Pillotina sp. SPG140]|jgi:hypothetical protein